MKKMFDKNDCAIFLASFLMSIIILFGITALKGCKEDTPKIIDTDTITIVKIDTIVKDTTITKTKLVPRYVTEIRRDTVYTKDGTPLELVYENKQYRDTICEEKDTVELQIFTSGVRSSVDSVSLRLRKSETVKETIKEITKYIEKPKKLKDRIHLSPNISLGYGIVNKKPDIYMGFGVTLDLQ